MNRLRGTEWELIQLVQDNNEIALGDTRPTLNFTDTSLNGNAGCNRFFSTPLIGAHTFSAGTIGATKKQCNESVMAIEQAYLGALDTVTQWHLLASQLLLVSADDKLVFQARQAADEQLEEHISEQITSFFGKALKNAIALGAEREFLHTLGHSIDRAAMGDIPSTAVAGFDFYKENVEDADSGSVRLYQMTIDDMPVYAVYVMTDGDDGWVELYDEAGDGLAFGRYSTDQISWSDEATIRSDI